MKILYKNFLFFLILSIFQQDIFSITNELKSKVVIIGGGPAGIIVAGLLLDLGVEKEDIIWIDPLFNVGRIGEFYSNVPGNAKNKLYVEFLKSCETFQKVKTESIEKLYGADAEDFGILSLIINPLQDITDYLRTLIFSIEGNVKSLEFNENCWNVRVNDYLIKSENVIFAIGSKPKILDYSVSDIIPLDYALDKETLSRMVNDVDKIAVIGSSHSAVLILKFLTEIGVKKILNFYKNEIAYAIDNGNCIQNSANGLKGVAAKWAKEILENNPPENLIRLKNTKENLDKFLIECNKIIYAIGYEMNNIPEINIEINPDPETGIIGPNLFGIGIAFPGNNYSCNGKIEQGIGLNSFMKYAQKVMVNWIKKSNFSIFKLRFKRKKYQKFEDFFNIEVL